MTPYSLLESLKAAQWPVVHGTFGNSHSTMIGVMADWWINADPQTHTVLEGGPSFRPLGAGMQEAGVCDAVFCRNYKTVGLLEVEGGRKDWTIRKVGKYFAAEYPELLDLEFAILLFYTYNPKGRGIEKTFAPAVEDALIPVIKDVSTQFPTKLLAILGLEKRFESGLSGIRTRNFFYAGRLALVTARVFSNGEEKASSILFQAH